MTIAPFKRIARFFPGLGDRLMQAGLREKPEDFVRNSLLIAFYLTTFVMVFLAIIFMRLKVAQWFLVFLFPMLFFFLFITLVRRPDAIIKKRQRKFDQEIVYAGKFLVMELQSGIPVYNSMISVSKSYPVVGRFFQEIINKIDMGTPMEDALNESIEITLSKDFRKILWQIYNSLKTGSDLAQALNMTIEQIAAEQLIQVKEYGRKLNPLVMFYMAVAIIFPSIGIIMMIVFSSFFSVQINLVVLMIVAVVVAFMQLFFLSVIWGQRPAVGV
ncbi:MAG: type II secretion system F family protein [Candidatus Woesearchaeota archaeon]